MIRLDEDALICDIAETYHIFNYKGLPPTLVAALSCGLGADSRIVTKLSGLKVPQSTIIKAAIFDRLSWLCWAQTSDGQKGQNRPQSLVETLLSEVNEEEKVTTFQSGADFDAAWKKAIGG